MREASHRQDDGTGYQDYSLDQLRVDSGGQAARYGVRGSQQGEYQDYQPEVGGREHELDDQRGSIQGSGCIQEYVPDYANPGKIVPGALVKPPFQKLRYGEYLRLDVKREKEDREENHDHHSREIVVEHSDPGMVRIAGLADQGGAGNAGGEQRKTHYPPWHGPACQEIRTRIPALAVPEAPPDDESQVQDDDHNVNDSY